MLYFSLQAVPIIMGKILKKRIKARLIFFCKIKFTSFPLTIIAKFNYSSNDILLHFIDYVEILHVRENLDKII